MQSTKTPTFAGKAEKSWKGFEEVYVPTSKGEIFYRHKPGTGKPIILIHGIGSDSRTWRKLMDFMPQNLDIYALDLIGNGKSDAPDMKYDVIALENCVEEFAERLKIKKPIVLGHSYGGWVAAEYALKKEVEALILEDSNGMENHMNALKKAGDNEAWKASVLAEALKIGGKEQTVRSMEETMDDHRLTQEQLSSISCKTLIIWGENDAIIGTDVAREFNSLIRGSKLVIIPEGEHVPHIFQKEVVGEVIGNFLKTV
jgi:pimeloyl-ACP methyl ester carboxylesterase